MDTHPKYVDALVALLDREILAPFHSPLERLDVCNHFVELATSLAGACFKARHYEATQSLLKKANALLATLAIDRETPDEFHITWLNLRLRVTKQLSLLSKRIRKTLPRLPPEPPMHLDELDESMAYVYETMELEYKIFDILTTDQNNRERLISHRASIAKAHLEISDFFAHANEHTAAAANAQHASSMLFEALVAWTKLGSHDIAQRDKLTSMLANALHSYASEVGHLDHTSEALQAYRKAYEITAACFGRDHETAKSMFRSFVSFSTLLKGGPPSSSKPSRRSPSPPKSSHRGDDAPPANIKQDRWRSSSIWHTLLKNLNHDFAMETSAIPFMKTIATPREPLSTTKPKIAVPNPTTFMFMPRQTVFTPVLHRESETPHKPNCTPVKPRPATARTPWNPNISTSPPKSPYAATSPPRKLSLDEKGSCKRGAHRPKTAGAIKANSMTKTSVHRAKTSPANTSPYASTDRQETRSPSPVESAKPNSVAKLHANIKLAEEIAIDIEASPRPVSKLQAKRNQRRQKERETSTLQSSSPPMDPCESDDAPNEYTPQEEISGQMDDVARQMSTQMVESIFQVSSPRICSLSLAQRQAEMHQQHVAMVQQIITELIENALAYANESIDERIQQCASHVDEDEPNDSENCVDGSDMVVVESAIDCRSSVDPMPIVLEVAQAMVESVYQAAIANVDHSSNHKSSMEGSEKASIEEDTTHYALPDDTVQCSLDEATFVPSQSCEKDSTRSVLDAEEPSIGVGSAMKKSDSSVSLAWSESSDDSSSSSELSHSASSSSSCSSSHSRSSSGSNSTTVSLGDSEALAASSSVDDMSPKSPSNARIARRVVHVTTEIAIDRVVTQIMQ
ncbi:hypothetical protein Ae201684_002184 [Aphanomyces euteiches]|uniref:Uncharacterized protein n=1 Tax=Aphanomyces euteiches TaxID=100861 RepID=A0A6G0XRN8_9STRA|nr:hypothetical protein Ae201684_002184 [Aphanomyces euteiches]